MNSNIIIGEKLINPEKLGIKYYLEPSILGSDKSTFTPQYIKKPFDWIEHERKLNYPIKKIHINTIEKKLY